MIRSVLLALALAATPAWAGEPTPPGAPGHAPAPEGKGAPAAPEGEEEVVYATVKAPLFSDQFGYLVIATVGGDDVLGEELVDAIMGAHGSRTDSAPAGKKDFMPLLERLINVRLLISEAREMGMEELPAVKKDLEAARSEVGLALLKEKVLEGVKAEPAEVERTYRAMVREWKVASALAYSEDAAKKLVAGVKAGKEFGALARQLEAEKKAKAGGEAEFLPRAKLQPQVLEALEATRQGAVSAPTRLKDGWAVMKVEDIRYPEDAKARAEATKAVLAQRRQAALERYYVGIIKRYATVDQALLKSIDFEAKKPGLEGYAKDQRVIARIKGAKDVTVADLTAELTGGFYHGAENAVAEKKANREKNGRFDGLLSSRIVPLEVVATGIPETAAFKKKLAARERQVLFSRFLETAILPELKFSEEQIQQYYQAHQKDFATPGFFRLEALAFADAKAAQGALDKLRGGTDFKWLAANADGLQPASQRKLNLDGGLYIATALPKALVDSLGGAGKGDYRLFSDDSPASYVVHVVDLIPPGVKPVEEARTEIGNALFNQALVKSIETWAGKLRPVRGVKVFITGIGS